jgi:hypothetical protein
MTPSRKVEIRLIVFIIFGISLAICMMFFLGCTTPPEKKDFENRPESCYDAAYCKYLSSVSKNSVSSDCADSGKECRALERYVKCKDDKFRSPEQKFQECWDKLNSK